MRRYALLGLWVLSACHHDTAPTSLTLRDQSRAEFAWICEGDDDCRIERIHDQPILPPCIDSTPGYRYSWNRFFEITAMCTDPDGIWLEISSWGRKAVCEVDDDCPQIADPADPAAYECRAGYCQNADHGRYPPDVLPTWFDMYILCIGDDPRSDVDGIPPDLEAALDAACPPGSTDPCEYIPEGCPDPR